MVPDDHVYFTIPGVDQAQVYTGVVLKRLSDGDGSGELNGSSWAAARDLAVIQADGDLPPQSTESELGFSIQQHGSVSFYGFPRDSATLSIISASYMTPNTVYAENQDQSSSNIDKTCTREITATAEIGDSGGPVVDDAGDVVGINIAEAENNTRLIFVPVACAEDFLAEVVPSTDGGRVIESISAKNAQALDAYLSDRKQQGGPTNLELLLAFRELGENPQLLPGNDEPKLRCPVVYSGARRDVDENGLMSWFERQNLVSLKAVGDQAYARGQAAMKKGDAGNAREYAGVAVASFTLLGKSMDLLDRSTGDLEVSSHSDRFVAATNLKSLADALVLYGLNGGSADMRTAQQAAAKSALIAPTNGQRGAALATLGQVFALDADSTSTARAFRASTATGLAPRWVTNAAVRWATAIAEPTSPLTLPDLRALGEGVMF